MGPTARPKPQPTQENVAFLSKTASAAVTNNNTGGGYLSPSKLTDGGSVRFALLSEEPLEFFECWGTAPDGSQKPFRFDYEPTPEDISTELAKQGKIEEALECARGISDESDKNHALSYISAELA